MKRRIVMCAPCKVVVNGEFVGNAAGLYHMLSDSDSARILALTAASADATFKHAINIGVMSEPDVDDWAGCDESAEIMSWVMEYHANGRNLTAEARTERDGKMKEWTRVFASTAHDVVSGKELVHDHGQGQGHSSDPDDDLLGG